jgi:CheY-like chemotaxis protein
MKRKSEIMKLEKKRRIHVFISVDFLVDFLSELIDEITHDHCELKVAVTTYADELLDLAKRRPFDLFVLFLNNIIFPDVNQPAEERIRKALRLVIHLKARYGKPIICLYGYPDDPSYGRQAKLAGADFVFRSPCDTEPLKEALEECLKDVLRTKILFVDDELSILDALKLALEDYSDTFSVLTARDGFTAKEKLKKNAVSLVVTNLNMPGIDGFELLDYIKAHYPNIPVIIFSGCHDPQKVRQAQDKGAAAYIKKPCSLEDLAVTIRGFLK